MTVPVNSRRRDHQGNGVATQYAAPMAYQKTHLAVYLIEEVDGVEVPTLVSPSAYAVTRFGVVAGSSVAFNTAPTSLQKILILRVVPYGQDVDVTNLGRFLPETIERGYDLLAMQVQQLDDRQLRALQGPDIYVGDDWNYDAQERRVVDLADPVDGGDAVNLRTLLSMLGLTRVNKTLAADYVDAGGSGLIQPAGLFVDMVAGRSYRVRFAGSVLPTSAPPITASPTSCIVGLFSDGLGGSIVGKIEVFSDAGLEASAALDSFNGLTGSFSVQTHVMSLGQNCPVMLEAIVHCTASGVLKLGMSGTGGGDPTKMVAGAVFSAEELI